MKRIYILLSLLAVFGAGLSAQKQSFEGYIAAADKAAAKDDHYNAYRLYSIAAEEGWSDDNAYNDRIGEVYYKAGTAAYRSTAYAKAEMFLVKLLKDPSITKYPLTNYYIGQSVLRQAKYDLAVTYFKAFINGQPSDKGPYPAIAREQIKHANWAIKELNRSEDITFKHLPRGINTQNSDVMYTRGPKGTRYISSNDTEWKKDSLTPHRNLGRIMRQTGEDSMEPLPALINVPGKTVAHSAFNKEMNKVYYSVCDFRNYDELICDVYRADVSADGKWSNPTKTGINVNGYSTTQPMVGYDADSGEGYLYFSSDRPGGKGGFDIYQTPLAKDGTLGTPVNLETINSEGDEASPFWYAPRKTLYFASNGLETFGGMDVQRSFYLGGEFYKPDNMGPSINSAADEAYYVRYDDPTTAYISSRRPTDEAIYYSDDKDVCCYDIYEFTPDQRIDIQVLTFNRLNGNELNGATVQLFKVTDAGAELVAEETHDEDNLFYFKGEPGMKYQLKASKDGFTEDLDEFDLSDPEFENVPLVVRRMELNPFIDLDVFAFNSADDSALPGATVKLYEETPNGPVLVKELTNNTDNDTHFQLEFGKKYRIEGSKPGFGQASDIVDLTDYDGEYGSTMRRDLYIGQQLDIYVIDGRNDEPLDNATIRLTKINGKVVGNDTNTEGNDFHYTVNLDQAFVLSTSRPGYYPRENDTLRFTQQDLIDGGGKLEYYVPLYPGIDDFPEFEVFFDNDHPNPRTTRTRTNLNYVETYQPYLDRMPAFRENAAEGLDDEQAFLVRGNINQFFDQEVIDGWKRLNRYAEVMLLHLQSGSPHVVELQGYASPRAATEYNRRLSSRRCSSVINFFREWNNGVLVPFMDSKALTFTQAALGESTAKLEKIYERLDAERESIYSTVASLERRVAIRSGNKKTSKK